MKWREHKKATKHNRVVVLVIDFFVFQSDFVLLLGKIQKWKHVWKKKEGGTMNCDHEKYISMLRGICGMRSRGGDGRK